MAAVVAASSMALSSPITSAAGPVEPYSDDVWVTGYEGGATAYFDWGSALIATNVVAYQGPSSAPTRDPRVGEVFYIRLASTLYDPAYSDDMTYRMDLRLPDGMTPVVSATYPISCELGTYDPYGRFWSSRAFDECGVTRVLDGWQFPAATISYADWSSVIWVPVRSTKAVSNGTIELLSTRTAGDYEPVPDPMQSTVSINVAETRPWAPRSVNVEPRIRQLAVSWSPPESNGGRRITGYVARAWTKSKGGFLVGSCRTDGARRCTINSLRRDRMYYVDVTAKSPLGSGPASARVGKRTL